MSKSVLAQASGKQAPITAREAASKHTLEEQDKYEPSRSRESKTR